MRKRNIFTTNAARMTAIVVMGMMVVTGCGSKSPASGEAKTETKSSAVAGKLLLSVNPEIVINYDDDGDVVSLEGLNDDGKNILKSYTDYEDKDCDDVARELVAQIDESGYFDNKISGHEPNIILKLEQGSKYPDDMFLEDITTSIQSLIDERSIGSAAMSIDQDDYDDQYEDKGYINAQTAEELLRAQLEREDIQFLEKDYDIEDGTYEIEFVLDGVEYEYEVDASTGKVVEADADTPDNDRDDDNDDDRDDDNDDDIDDDLDDDNDDDNDDDRNDA